MNLHIIDPAICAGLNRRCHISDGSLIDGAFPLHSSLKSRTDVVGNTLLLDSEKDEYTITGVIRDMPNNSHFKLDVIRSIISMGGSENFAETWGRWNFYTYVLLKENTDPNEFRAKFPDWIKGLNPQWRSGL